MFAYHLQTIYLSWCVLVLKRRYKPWYHKAAYQDKSELVIRNEFYSHIQGERRSAYPCQHDQSLVCFTASTSAPPPGDLTAMNKDIKNSNIKHFDVEDSGGVPESGSVSDDGILGGDDAVWI